MKRKIRLWVDDTRPAPGSFISCRSYKEAITAFEMFTVRDNMEIELISLDHDLGGKKTGYDIAKYIVEHKIPIDFYQVHSMNSVGRFNIEQLLDHYGYKNLGQG